MSRVHRVSLLIALLALLMPAAPAQPTQAATTTTTFSNLQPIRRFSADVFSATDPYPSTIRVRGFPKLAPITKVTVTLNALKHVFPTSLEISLQGPNNGSTVMLMNETGGFAAVSGVTLTFDDVGATIPSQQTLTSGTYHGTDFNPQSPGETRLSTFNGGDPNGTWSLFFSDNCVCPLREIAGGWSITITTSTTFANNRSITLPSSGAASPYPSMVQVASYPGYITDLTVTLDGLNHVYPDDLDVLLVGPGGQRVLLLSDAGGAVAANDLTLTFDDAAPATAPDSGRLTTGAYRPTNYGAGDSFPGPAPGGSYATSLAAFDGLSPNGVWSLFIVDDQNLDGGSVARGWNLTFVTTNSNTPPVLAPVGNRTLDEGRTIAITVSANDADFDTVTFSATGLPLFAELAFVGNGQDGNRTAELTLNPDYAAAGTYPITLSVSDGQFSDSETITLTVRDSNRAPVITVSPVVVVWEGQASEVTVSAIDPDGDAIVDMGTTSLPSFASFDYAPGDFEGLLGLSPDSDDAGSYGAGFWATDGQQVGTTTIEIGVRDDSTPPTTTATSTPAANTAGWHNTNPTVTLTASDGSGAGVRRITYSASGAQTIPLTVANWHTRSFQITAEGTTTIKYYATDYTGNIEATKTLVVKLDKTAPVMSTLPPLQLLSPLRDTSVRASLKWQATDTGSGIDLYQVEESVNGAAFVHVPRPLPTTTQVTLNLAFGDSYAYRLRASDIAGNVSPWSIVNSFTLAAHQEDSPNITYSGAWTTVAPGGAWGGSMRYAHAAGARATFTFQGSAFVWVTSTSTNRGLAEVWIDGQLARTIDLYSAATRQRALVFDRHWPTAASHTVEIRVLGTHNPSATNSRVYLDGFIVLSP